MGGSSSVRVLRTSLGTVFLASLLWFLFVFILVNQNSEKAAITISSTRNLNLLTFIGSKRRSLHRGDPSLNSVSKRRVPNGPDPIHNRRARNSGEPPTRA